MVAPEILKARISRVIAATRFPFVGQDDWDETRTTIANDPRDPEWFFETHEVPARRDFHGPRLTRQTGDVHREPRTGVKPVPLPGLELGEDRKSLGLDIGGLIFRGQ